MRLFLFLCWILCCWATTARTPQHVFLYNHGTRGHPSTPLSMIPPRPSFRRRRRRSKMILLARRVRDAKTPAPQIIKTEEKAEKPLTMDDLGLVAKTVARTLELAIVFGIEYAQGWIGGYVLGTVTGVPALLFQKTASLEQKFTAEVGARFGRMNAKSVRWAKQWAPISAIFGGFNAGARIVRGGVDDEWNAILSSAAAGAYFSRNGGPVAMARGAALYGGLTYLLVGRSSDKGKLEYAKEVELK